MNGRQTPGRQTIPIRRVALAFLLLVAAIPHAVHGQDTAAPAASAPAGAPAEIRSHLAELRAEIAHHDELYFRHAAPEITDAAYDALKRELAELERAFPAEAGALAPGAAPLGDDRTGDFPTYRHRERMLSLDKVYSPAELRIWHRQLLARLGRRDATLVVEPKYDGLAVSVTYERGRLVRAVTRGDGAEGDDITANVRTICALPGALRSTTPPDRIELRGELYVSRTEFERLNAELEADGEPAFANPRNLAAGTAKLRDPVEVAARKLEIVFYGWGACEPASATPASQQRFLAQAKEWGLPVVESYRLAHNATELREAVQEIGRSREALPFPTDGAVAKLDSVPLRRSLGETEQAPRWAVAYKFTPNRATTRLRAIAIQVGRTGLLTPVAEFDPVELAGTTVDRATLHNRDTIVRLDLQIGDFVVLEKAGDVVPRIAAVDRARRPANATPFTFPEQCPACATPLEQLAGEAAVRCPNVDCPARIRGRLDHFAGKAGVDIHDLGPATVTVLVDHGVVRDIPDLYRLRRTDLIALPGFGPKSTDDLLAAIARSRHASVWRMINGLGLPRTGPATAKKLARRFGSLDRLAAATYGELIPLVGPATARALVGYLAEPQNRATLLALAALQRS